MTAAGPAPRPADIPAATTHTPCIAPPGPAAPVPHNSNAPTPEAGSPSTSRQTQYDGPRYSGNATASLPAQGDTPAPAADPPGPAERHAVPIPGSLRQALLARTRVFVRRTTLCP